MTVTSKNKLVYFGSTLFDTSAATAVPADVCSGKTFVDKDGVMQTGSYVPQTDNLIPMLANTLTTADLTNLQSKIYDYAFYDRYNLEHVISPYVTRIGKQSFYWCTNLIDIDTENCTNIGEEAFVECYQLTSVDLSSARIIGKNAFVSCTSLTTINAPQLYSLNYGTFSGCTSLTRATFSSELGNINGAAAGYDAPFEGCTALEELVINSYAVPTLSNAYLFSKTQTGVPATFTNFRGIFVPDARVEQYKQESNYSVYSSLIKPISEL